MRSEEREQVEPGARPAEPGADTTLEAGVSEAETQPLRSEEEEGGRRASGAVEGGEGGSPEVEELRDRYLRLAAEFDNYRKRTDRERLEDRDRAQAQIVERLLESIDDLQRVTEVTSETAAVEAVLEGVRLVEQKLLRTLEAEGLERVEAKGKPFDPEIHEALMTTPTNESAEDHTVGEVFQNGYLFRGRL